MPAHFLDLAPGERPHIIVSVPLAEKQLISRIRRLAANTRAGKRRNRASGLIAGIGDDCAVLRIPAAHDTLITTDFSLEGVHFRRDWHSPEFIGHRCLTRGLSDIAAMGGQPAAIFLSLGLPAATPTRWVDGFLNGLLRLADNHNVPLAGGDTTQSPDRIVADIAVLGSAPKGRAVLRSGARPGDRIYVTGVLGGAAADIDALYKGFSKTRNHQKATWPEPRIDIGRSLRERKIASAMIDISDGLSTDLLHICEESGVGARLIANAIPRAERARCKVDFQFALHGGDSYELLFTAHQRVRVPQTIEGVQVSEIGEIVRQKNMKLISPAGRQSPLFAQGWEHFSGE